MPSPDTFTLLAFGAAVTFRQNGLPVHQTLLFIMIIQSSYSESISLILLHLTSYGLSGPKGHTDLVGRNYSSVYNFCSLLLKLLSDLAETDFSSNLFQILMTISIKKCLTRLCI